MAFNRDNFTVKTVDILAKRVGYLCSNPECRRYTVGPNTEKNKATIVGVAAHITAAAPGGPRYDSTLEEEQRKDIDNGIWLCVNCSTIIDKNSGAFPTNLLQEWKKLAEEAMNKSLLGFTLKTAERPSLEADLLWANSQRWNKGYSAKNRELYGNYIVLGENAPIIFWELLWNFHFAIYNNSTHPVFNVRVAQIDGHPLTYLDKLPKINNLPPYADIKLNAKFQDYFEGTGAEADKLIRPKVPDIIQGLKIRILYEDEKGNHHSTIFTISGDEATNEQG